MLEAYAKPYGLGIGLKHWPRSAVNNNKLTGLEVIKLAELEKFSFNKSKPFTFSQLNFVELPQLN